MRKLKGRYKFGYRMVRVEVPVCEPVAVQSIPAGEWITIDMEKVTAMRIMARAADEFGSI